MARAASDKADAEKQLKGFIAKFDSNHQTVIRAARKALRERFPTATELVQTLLILAANRAKTPMPAQGKGRLIIRSISAKQRPRCKTAKKT